MGENDILGEAPYEVGYHHQNGTKKPLTDEQIKCEALAHLKEELDEAIRFNNTEEIARCQQAYLDINNGVGCKTKAEIEASIPYKIQDSIDAYNLELIEMGVL